MLSKEKLILLFCFLLLKPIFGQHPTSYNYTTTEGLPSSETYDVIQDQKGYIWIATDRGVSRFDGYSFKNFTSNEGLIDNTVLSLYEDVKGRIWFHGISGRLCYYENEKIVPYKYNDVLTKDKGSIIRSFNCDENDNLIIGTLKRGLLSIDSNGKLENIDPEMPDGRVFTATILKGKFHLSVWTSYTPNGKTYLAISKEKNLAHRVIFHVPSVQFNISGIHRKNGSIVLYGGGFLMESKDTSVRAVTSANNVVRIFEDKDSCLWISFRGGGIRKYDPNQDFSNGNYQTYLKNEVVTGVCEDKERGVWLSTLSSGLFYFPSLQYTSFSFPPKHVLTAMDGSLKSDSIFLGFSNGLISIQGPQGAVKTFNTNKNTDSVNHIYSIRSYEKSSVFVSTTNGALLIQNNSSIKNVNEVGYSRFNIVHGTTFYGCGNSKVIEYDITANKTKVLYSLSIRADVIYIDKKGEMWIGDFTGLYYMKDSVATKAFPNVPALSQRISGIVETEDGKMIVTTIGKGMMIIENNKIKYLEAKDGLASDIINCIALRENEIWLGTNKGICRVILHKGSSEIRNYTVENGMPGNEISNITISANYIWAITKKDLFYFDPEKVLLNTVEPGIWIESASAGGTEIDITTLHDIKHDQFPLKLNYIALSYKKRGNVQYRYKLKGLSDDWQYTRSTYVEFLSLPAGNYSFEISAQNEDGVWNSKPFIYNFSIIPPFWKTWWFTILIFGLSLLIIFIYFYYRLETVKKKNQMITDILNYKQQALLNQMNPHFIFNSLNSIQTFILTEEKKLATRYISKFARLMRLSLDNSRSEFIPLEREIETMQLYLELEKLRFKEMFSYSVRVDPEIRIEKLLIPAMLIQPYLENCIKHAFSGRTGREGEISLKIYLDKTNLMCSIEDNGIGREETQRNKALNVGGHESAGMSITEERLKLISATLHQEFRFEIVDKKDQANRSLGTIVIFALPHKDIV